MTNYSSFLRSVRRSLVGRMSAARGIRHPVTHAVVLIVLAGVVSACSNGLDAALTAPPGAPAPLFTLSGVVSEMTPGGLTPIGGVVIQAQGTRPVLSDATGAYSIPGLSAIVSAVTVAKFPFESQAQSVSITADTRLDLLLARRPAFSLSGEVFEIDATGEITTPLEGVVVQALTCDPDVRNCTSAASEMTTTDQYGQYLLAGLVPGVNNNFLWVNKAGYESQTPGPVGCDGCTQSVSISGDTHLDIALVRR